MIEALIGLGMDNIIIRLGNVYSDAWHYHLVLDDTRQKTASTDSNIGMIIAVPAIVLFAVRSDPFSDTDTPSPG